MGNCNCRYGFEEEGEAGKTQLSPELQDQQYNIGFQCVVTEE